MSVVDVLPDDGGSYLADVGAKLFVRVCHLSAHVVDVGCNILDTSTSRTIYSLGFTSLA